MAKNNLPNFKYIFNNKSDTLDVLLHGSGVGMNSQFMLKILSASEKSGHSVITFNFPFFDRGDDLSSGQELVEEVGTLTQVIKFCDARKYKKIRLIGKSLGGIVASFYLKTLLVGELNRYEIIIFGYVSGSVRLLDFPGRITIIQGQQDRFGGIDRVKTDLKNSKSSDIHYYEVKAADHSYRDPETMEPLYEDEALSYIFK